MKPEQTTLDTFRTYLATIKNSVGGAMFRELFVRTPDGKRVDILRSGKHSCAMFVSSILKLYDLIDTLHATVRGTIRDIESHGWKMIPEPRIGAILVWEQLLNDEGEWHRHIGFYVGDELAVSNSWELRSPQLHHVTYGTENPRKITHIFWKEGLDKE